MKPCQNNCKTNTHQPKVQGGTTKKDQCSTKKRDVSAQKEDEDLKRSHQHQMFEMLLALKKLHHIEVLFQTLLRVAMHFTPPQMGTLPKV